MQLPHDLSAYAIIDGKAITVERVPDAITIAVLPPGFVLTQEKADKIFQEHKKNGKPLTSDDVTRLFASR